MSIERLGDVTVPSGVLAVYDVGLVGLVLAGRLPEVPTVRVSGLPTDRALAVVGQRLADGDWGDNWNFVAVEVAAGDVASSEPAGEVPVDFARILLADEGAAADWEHNDPIDGLADYVFWGRDAAQLAEEVGAPLVRGDTFGWENVPVADAIRLGTAAEERKAAGSRVVASDYRPHSHHWQALARMRESDTLSGTIDVGGRTVCLFHTQWGDGVYPVFRDLAADGRLLRVRVQLYEPRDEDDEDDGSDG